MHFYFLLLVLMQYSRVNTKIMSVIEKISKNSFVTVIIILAVPIIVILPLVLLLEAGKIGGEASENCSNHSTSLASPKPKPMCLTPECITLAHQLVGLGRQVGRHEILTFSSTSKTHPSISVRTSIRPHVGNTTSTM